MTGRATYDRSHRRPELESSAEYYRIINQGVRNRLGGVHSAQILMWSFDFAAIEVLQREGDWAGASREMVDIAQRLERGGAELVLICSNTMHCMAEAVSNVLSVPLLHIVDPTADQIRAAGCTQVGLLGTAFTMEQRFYSGRLQKQFGLEVFTPDEADRAVVHRIIYEELVRGIIRPQSRDAYRGVINRLVRAGAEAIILGCTEIMLLVDQADSPVPLYDTTALHAAAAVEWAVTPLPAA